MGPKKKDPRRSGGPKWSRFINRPKNRAQINSRGFFVYVGN